ncbi:MAG: thiamine pyrophosphate-binding protein [Fibromonadales bacterium]|nr:thiamine pyrophosphate-binding protein [Fibromonadales bacterium]
MTVAEYMMDFLKKKGVDTAFVITGGQAMYLNDALCRTHDIRSIFVHHEQAATMSADAYSRITGKLGFVLVTAGPGAINATNGLVGGFTDSAPMMVISGQSNLAFVEYMSKSNIRQYGVQGINTRDFVEKGVKYFATVDDPAKIAYYMERAYYMALEGRPGPVWLEVPLNVQGMQVPEKILYSFTPEESLFSAKKCKEACEKIANALSNSKRPLVMAGQGVRLAGVVDEFMQFIEKNNIPVITTRLGIDLIEYEHPLFVGHPGNYGDRPANITAQNADVIVVLGSRMSTSSIGHDSKMFGRNADIYVVDVDKEELNKPGPNIKGRFMEDLRFFMPELNNASVDFTENHDEWAKFCENLKHKYPVMLPEYRDGEKVNSYYLIDQICELLDNETAVLVDTGSCFHVAAQGWKLRKGQRFLTTGGLSSMGYWCAVLGACAANNYKNTIVITGDGSLQMNIQEFATIKHLNKPIKVIIINNNGYLLIRQTQRTYMEDRFFGESPESGLFCPDTMAIAAAYGIKGVRIENPGELESKLRDVLEYDKPVICEVMCPEWQAIIPRVSSDKLPDGTLRQRNFEDMYPFLPENELASCMIGKKT